MRRLPAMRVTPGHVSYKGGLDLISPPLLAKPGTAIAAINYEADRMGGYSRIDGYERYDGKPSPSEQTYLYCPVTFSDTVSVGDTILGSSSGATGEVIVVGTDHIDIVKVTGVWEAEEFTVGGSPKGEITSVPVENGEITAQEHATALSLTANTYRDDINVVPGDGPVRGVAIYKGDTYAFRDDGAVCKMYKSTSVGWGEVPFFSEISFDTGVSQIFEGVTITQDVSGATATVRRVIVSSGAWGSSDAAGKLVISNITGTFDATNLLKVSAVTAATSTSLATSITLLAGGKYETVNYNFYASTDTFRMYGCDGVNRAFEFDGVTFTPIDTGMDEDTPKHIAAWKKHLFLSFKGSLQNSALGEPLVWSALVGAAEIGIGDDITGLLVQPGDVLAVFARNSAFQLNGTSVSDFVMSTISSDVGCIEWTSQNIGSAYVLDDRGLIRVSPTDAYGNFAQKTISQQIQPLIDRFKPKVVSSTTYKSSDQYRLYGDDGSGIIMTLAADRKSYFYTEFKYPVVVSCSKSGEDSTGGDVVFFGAENGFVYQTQKGSSFDGEEIEAVLKPVYDHFRSPAVTKRFRRGEAEMTSVGYSSISVTPDFSYATPEISLHATSPLDNLGSGGFWDVSTWESFYYDSQIYTNPSFSVVGVGENIGLTFYSKSDTDLGHNINGVTINYTPLRVKR